VGVQEVRLGKGGTVRHRIIFFSMEKEMKISHCKQYFNVHHSTVSAAKTVEFVSDGMSYISERSLV
jgi:hypothetical protein